MGDYGSVYRHVFPDTLSRRQINKKTASASCLQIKQEASVISAMRERSLFHDIICNGNSASEHRLLFDYPVSTTKEKRFFRNGRVRCNPPSADGTLQRIANQRSNALSLIVLMDIKPVQITRSVHVSETDDHTVHSGNNGSVFPERTVPCLQVLPMHPIVLLCSPSRSRCAPSDQTIPPTAHSRKIDMHEAVYSDFS